MRVAIRLALAAISLVIGVAGLLLPVLPGWLFLGLAALLLFPNASLSGKIVRKIEERWPSTHRILHFLLR